MLGLGLVQPALHATIWDQDRERAIAEKLTEDLESGDVIWLSQGNQEFPGIFTPPDTNWHPNAKQEAVILLHGMGGHPDWPVVISPLRKFFNLAGWTSLSIQLPVLSAETPLSEYGITVREAARRIKSGVEYLHDNGYAIIVVAGYGFGAATAAWYLANDGEDNVCAFAGISMHARKFLNPQLDLTGSLGKLHIPVLDIYGSNDLKAVTQTADDRRLAIRENGNSFFTQISIDDTDQYYTHKDRVLFDSIKHWLESLKLRDRSCSVIPTEPSGAETTRY